MERNGRVFWGVTAVLLILLLLIFAVATIHFWQRGTIDPGNVVRLQSHFAIDRNFSRTEYYEGEPCVAYKGGSFMAMESYRVPFFSDRMRDANLIRVAYVPAGTELKESECAWGTTFKTQVNTWFAWEEGGVFVTISLEKLRGERNVQ